MRPVQNVRQKNLMACVFFLTCQTCRQVLKSILLVGIFLTDLFYFLDSLCKLFNYADDSTLSSSNKDLTVVEQQLTTASQTAIELFGNCFMQANTAKFQLALVSTNPKVGILKFVQGVILHSKELCLGCTCSSIEVYAVMTRSLI